MKKKTLAILFLGFMGLKSVANPVSPEEARQVAERFFRNLGAEDGTSMDVRRSPVALRSSRPGGSPYYICAPRSGSGFVVVSGDDALPPVVGYSLDAPVAGKELPPQLEGFLSAYSAYVDVTRQGGVSVPEARGTAAAYEAVSPLLTTKWGQGYPYNGLCPDYGNDRAAAGCVAVAMAQIMNYHRWPERGSGVVDGTDLSTHVYDWAHIKDSYAYTTDGSGTRIPADFTESEGKAVAVLMSDAGRALGTRYGLSASEAYHHHILGALFRHFGYAPTAKFRYRKLYTKDTWMRLIREELSAGRPIAYSGRCGVGDEDGHSFVCDGMDGNGLLHINWGWDGTFNGYFDIDILQPEGEGTGHDADGYVYRAAMVTGIRPMAEGDPATLDEGMVLEDFTASIRNGGFFLALRGIINTTDQMRRVNPSIVLYHADGSFVCREKCPVSQSTGGVKNLMSGEILAEADCRASFSGLEPGTYHFRVENDPFSDGKTFERFETGELPDGGTLKVSADGALEVGQAEKGYHRLEMISCRPTMTCYAGWDVVEVEACIHNAGNAAYEGDVDLCLIPEGADADGSEKHAGAVSRVVVTGGASPIYYAGSNRTFRMSVQVPEQPGRYRVRFKEAEDYLPEASPCYVEVLPRPDEPLFQLTSPLDLWTGQEIVQASDVHVGLNAECRRIPSADGKEWNSDTELYVYALREGDDPSQEMRLFGGKADFNAGTVNIDTQTPLLSVLPEGYYRLYLKYFDGTEMRKAEGMCEGYDEARVHLLPAETVFPYLAERPSVNGGKVCRRYSTVDIELPLSATGDFKGYIKVEDTYFNGNKWVEFLTSGMVRVDLRAGETTNLVVKGEVWRETSVQREISVTVFDEEYSEVGQLALHPAMRDGYGYYAENGEDRRLKLAAPAEFSNMGYLDAGKEGTLKLRVCSNEPSYRNGRLVVCSKPVSGSSGRQEPLQAEPVAVNLPVYSNIEVEIPFVCHPQAADGYYVAMAYLQTDDGAAYAVLPDGLDKSLEYCVRGGSGVASHQQDRIHVSMKGNMLCVDGMDGTAVISVYATDGKRLYVSHSLETPVWTMEIPREWGGRPLAVVVESEAFGKVVRKIVLK